MTEIETTTKGSGFIAKRRERLEAAGVLSDDMIWATTSYVGAGATNCCLCDHPIKNCFELRFNRPDASRVVLFPVGSDCILTWARSMPLTPEREAFLASLKAIEKRLRAEKKAKKARTQELIRLQPADRDLVIRARDVLEEGETWLASKLGARDLAALKDISSKAVRYGSFASPAQRGFLTSLVSRSERLLDQHEDGDGSEDEGKLVLDRQCSHAGCQGPVCEQVKCGHADCGATCRRDLHDGPGCGPECGKCGAATRKRSGSYGAFWGCVRYPDCRWTQNAYSSRRTG